MWLIVGLGNPDKKYAGNRHNVGFMTIEQIASDYSAPDFQKKFLGIVSRGTISGHSVLLLKPMNYMNNSGLSVAQAATFFKIPPERIIVFYDELDLKPGQIKVRKGGGAAGHNGIRSMMAQLPSPDFWRARIGIGHPGDKSRVSGYVLSDFAKADQAWLDKLLPAISDHLPLLLEENDSDFMTRVAEAMK